MIDKKFQYEGKQVNLQLAEVYARRLWDLEEQVANDAATTARTSTQLRKMLESFEGALEPKQVLALQTAAAVTAKLADDLKCLRPWMKAYEQYLADRRARRRHEALLAESKRRCIEDEDAVAEAHDLLAFLPNDSKGDEVEAFIRSHRNHQKVWWDIVLSDRWRVREDLSRALATNDIESIRKWSMLLIEALDRSHSHGDMWKVGAEDFSIWRDAQRDARKAATVTKNSSSRDR